jgi:putative spermidine/putrescine transport system permease protein
LKSKIESLWLAIFFLFTAVPIGISFGYAALYSFGIAGILPGGFTISNWTHTLFSSEVIFSFLFSIYVATISMALTIASALFLTSIFRKDLKHGWQATIIYLPLAVPSIVAAFFTFQLFTKAGFLSRIFYQLGWINNIQQFPDLIHDAFGIGIISTHVMMAVPFFVIYLTNLSLAENIEELLRSARTLGASFFQAEFKIAIPILLRKAFPAIVLYFIFVLGSYEIPLLLGRQFPQMVSVLMIRKLQRFNLLDIPTAYAMAVLYLLITGMLIILLFRKRKLGYDF